MTLGYFGGVKVDLHPLLFPVAAVAVWLGQGLALLTALVCLFGHEIAHVLAARLLGMEVERLHLLPFGGVATFRGYLETRPRQEFWVSAAGPLWNLLCCAGILALHGAMALPPRALQPFFTANAALAAVNLLPALPLDGGRMFRAALAPTLGLRRATRIAAALGVAVALALFALCAYLWWSGEPLNLTLLTVAVALGVEAVRARREMPFLLMRDLTHKRALLERERLLRVRAVALSGKESVRAAVSRFVPQRYHVVTVLDGEYRAVGEVDEGKLISHMLAGRGEMPLSQCVR